MMHVYEAEVGILEPEVIPMVSMPRKEFMVLYDEALAHLKVIYGEGAAQGIDKELRPIAESMPRFPLGAWINTRRGCGCIVGEYLVARAEVDRYNFIMGTLRGEAPSNMNIASLMRTNPLRQELVTFGIQIDAIVTRYVRRNAESDRADDVKSVEIVG